MLQPAGGPRDHAQVRNKNAVTAIVLLWVPYFVVEVKTGSFILVLRNDKKMG